MGFREVGHRGELGATKFRTKRDSTFTESIAQPPRDSQAAFRPASSHSRPVRLIPSARDPWRLQRTLAEDVAKAEAKAWNGVDVLQMSREINGTAHQQGMNATSGGVPHRVGEDMALVLGVATVREAETAVAQDPETVIMPGAAIHQRGPVRPIGRNATRSALVNSLARRVPRFQARTLSVRHAGKGKRININGGVVEVGNGRSGRGRRRSARLVHHHLFDY